MLPTNRWRFNLWGLTPKKWVPTLNAIRALPETAHPKGLE